MCHRTHLFAQFLRSAGSHENWRLDQAQFNQADIGKPLQGWEGEVRPRRPSY
jgi:hypothetical protein